MTEQWLPVVGYEGYYEVSNLGRVRSLERRVRNGHNGATRLVRARILQPSRCSATGHVGVTLSRDSKYRTFKVHLLELIAFKGPRPPGMETRHIDGVADNNELSNLAWGTREENVADRLKYDEQAQGERCGSAKLTNEQVLQIRLLVMNGEFHQVLADRFGVSQSAITNIVTGKRWKHLPVGKRTKRVQLGEQNGQARLCTADVYEIRALTASGACGAQVAAMFGVSASAVYKIAERRSWRHLPEREGV